MLFSKARPKDSYEIVKVIKSYTKTSEQRINLHNSRIIFSKDYPQHTKNAITNILGMEECDKPGIYLDLAADWGRSKQQMLKEIIEKVIAKTTGWRENLSQAGKEILTKAVLQAIPAYSMAILRYPISLCKNIAKHLANFW